MAGKRVYTAQQREQNRLRAKRAREKKKGDPIHSENEKERHKIYRAKKAAKGIELTREEKAMLRERQRINSQAYRLRKKLAKAQENGELNNEDDANPRPTRTSKRGRGEEPDVVELPTRTRMTETPAEKIETRPKLLVRMPFSRQPQAKKLYRQMADLKQQLAEKEKCQTPSPRHEEKKMVDEPMLSTPSDQPPPAASPFSAAKSLASAIDVTPRPDRIKQLLPFTVMMEQVASAPTKVKKVLFSTEKQFKSPHKYKGVKKLISLKAKLSRDYVFSTARKRSTIREQRASQHKEMIVEFLKREDNSYCLPSKKDQVRGARKYALGDTMRNLHAKFILEFPHIAVSMATFSRARPSYIYLTKFLQRRVCLCQRHANVALMAEASKVLPRSTTAITDLTDEEIVKKMDEISVGDVKHHQWEKVDKLYNGKKISKVNLIEKSLPKEDFIKAFTDILPGFRDHCSRVQEQHLQVRYLQENMMKEIEATLQLDYAENWNAKYLYEITSAYYDKNQVTVHPMVLNMKDAQGIGVAKTYVGITEVKAHSVPTTYTFLKSLMVQLKTDCPKLKLLHFVTDSPSSQYRNRSICDLVAHFPALFSIKASWSWLESGHGKGPCDGVGGGVKRLADNLVKSNKIITSAEEFVNKIRKTQTKMTLLHIKADEVEQSREEIERWGTQVVKGLLNMHVVAPVKKHIYMRKTSCFKLCCYKDGVFKPTCTGWEKTPLKLHRRVNPNTAIPQPDQPDQLQSDVQPNEANQPDQPDQLQNDVQPHEANQPDQPDQLQNEVQPHEANQPEGPEFQINKYATIMYGRKWYLGRIDAINLDESQEEEYTVSFLSRCSNGWKWTKRRETCVLPIHYLLKSVVPEEDGKIYRITATDVSASNELLRISMANLG